MKGSHVRYLLRDALACIPTIIIPIASVVLGSPPNGVVNLPKRKLRKEGLSYGGQTAGLWIPGSPFKNHTYFFNDNY